MIAFDECAVCDTFSECGNQWTIYYDKYTSSITYPHTNSDKTHRTDATSQLALYIEQQHNCPFNNDLESEPIKILSIIISIFCTVTLFIILVCFSKGITIKCYHKYKFNVPSSSSKPSLSILLYSIF